MQFPTPFFPFLNNYKSCSWFGMTKDTLAFAEMRCKVTHYFQYNQPLCQKNTFFRLKITLFPSSACLISRIIEYIYIYKRVCKSTDTPSYEYENQKPHLCFKPLSLGFYEMLCYLAQEVFAGVLAVNAMVTVGI